MRFCLSFYFIIFSSTLKFSAQIIEHIQLKKDKSTFLFFQNGTTNDTIIHNKSDVFYLLLSDSVKQNCYIETENAQILSGKNDSLVVLKYLPGINYMNKFVVIEDEIDVLINDSKSRKIIPKLKMITLINGAGNLEKTKIKVSFINTQSKKTFAEFIYLIPKN